jgi:prevent-host-death family protein
MDHDPNRKGNAAELAIAAEATRLDLLVYYPLTEHGHADLVLGIGGRLWRVQSHVWLRTDPAKNGQRAALNWAEQYRLGAVAQLAERRRGTAEARGSNPLSSIPPSESSEEVTDNVIDVGAHQFRNHFGYYMEQAVAGAEVVVSRRGRPYVCMVGS